VIPGWLAPEKSVMRITFQPDDEELGGNARQIEATEFACWWRDRFGTVHFVVSPDDGSWQEWWDREEDDGYPQLAEDRDGETGARMDE
jgi:hypothetical protein